MSALDTAATVGIVGAAGLIGYALVQKVSGLQSPEINIPTPNIPTPQIPGLFASSPTQGGLGATPQFGTLNPDPNVIGSSAWEQQALSNIGNFFSNLFGGSGSSGGGASTPYSGGTPQGAGTR